MWVLPPTNQPIQSIHHTSLLIMVSISQLCTFPKCSYFYECECVELSVVFQNAHILNDCGCVELSALSEIEICDLIFLLYFFDLSYMNLFCTPKEVWNILNTELIDFYSAFLEDPMSTVWRVLNILWPFCCFFRCMNKIFWHFSIWVGTVGTVWSLF